MTASAVPPVVPATATASAYTYTIPEADRQPGDPQKITLRSRYPMQVELDALKVATSAQGISYELLQRIITKIDGKPVDQGAPFMENWSPRVRLYAVDALNDVSMPKSESRTAFLASKVTDVG